MMYTNKWLISFLFTFCIIVNISNKECHAQTGDTTVIQAFTFGSPQDAWFVFPSDTISYEKILMTYTLKCNPAQNPACGEWDYLTYTYLWDHTGVPDSNLLSHPNFLYNGSTPDTLMYMNQPSWTYILRKEYFNNTPDTSVAELSGNSDTIAYPLSGDAPDSRTLLLWKAADLSAQGLHQGDITSIAFNLSQANCNLQELSIAMKNVISYLLDANNTVLTGTTEVYSRNTNFASSGWSHIAFTHPFYWDGTSDLLIEISYKGSQNIIAAMTSAEHQNYQSSLSSRQADTYLQCDGHDYIEVPPAVFSGIDSSLTVAFWVYGNPAVQPQDGCLFEGINAANQRVFNVHLPWSNGRVYWDCGNTGGTYDRIDKACDSAAMYEGQWNYWAFVKDLANQSMSIYFNGQLWHSATAKTLSLETVAKMKIAAGGDGSWGLYNGNIDEFSIWDAALSPSEISELMYQPISPSHPAFAHLRAYYPMNEAGGYILNDASSNNHPATMIGMPEYLNYQGAARFKNFLTDSLLPAIRFGQGIAIANSVDSIFVEDSIAKPQMMIILFADSLQPTTATDTILAWPPYFNDYIYDAAGLAIDSTFINPTDTLYKKTWFYYSEPFEVINRFELARYITPYGNGLSLGNGWTWTFDVSDYRTLLHDSVHLSAGNWQELLDMKFLMIKGTPDRDVLGIRNLWNGGFNYGQSPSIETWLTPLQIVIPPAAKAARWKSRITGHGMDTPENCAEFCPKTHYFKVDGTQRFSQLVWRDNCDLNPLYPQGGTWVYDRANWCPGAEVWTYDFELTPYITSGDSVVLDHDVQPYTNTGGWDYFQIEDQIVFYGPPHFTLDAAIERVLSPTSDVMWKRKNPICAHPSVIIKNNGSTNLQSLDITYGIHGAPASLYHWTGDLKFLETATVVLDTFAWAQGASRFDISINNPNGGNDQYAYNNSVSTPYSYVPVLPGQIVIEVKSNSNPAENQYTLKDDQGNILLSRSGLTANTTYRDTLNLTDGCYEFQLTDSGEDGLSFWANTGQGSGSAKIRSASLTTQVYKTFGSDFGGEILYNFTVGLTSHTEEYSMNNIMDIDLYPNPADDIVNIDISYEGILKGIIEVSDILGNKVWSQDVSSLNTADIKIDVSKWPAGIYVVSYRNEKESYNKKVVIN